MRVIGIDPGLRKTGWGIIEVDGDNIYQIANGTCDTKVSESLAFRLRVIFEELTKVVKAHSPDHAAVENTFVNKDATSTLKLGQARGICMLVPALSGLRVEEYAPNAVKKAVVGVGHATKDQVEYMIKIQFPNTVLNGPDATDALAVAICHASHLRYSMQMQMQMQGKLLATSQANDW